MEVHPQTLELTYGRFNGGGTWERLIYVSLGTSVHGSAGRPAGFWAEAGTQTTRWALSPVPSGWLFASEPLVGSKSPAALDATAFEIGGGARPALTSPGVLQRESGPNVCLPDLQGPGPTWRRQPCHHLKQDYYPPPPPLMKIIHGIVGIVSSFFLRSSLEKATEKHSYRPQWIIQGLPEVWG